MKLAWMVLLVGDLVVGELQPLKTYQTDVGSLTAIHWGTDSEVWHLGDLEFEFRNDDAALEFVFDPVYLGGLAGSVEVGTGEEHWFYGGRDQQLYLDEPGIYPVQHEWTMDELIWDWVAPEDEISPVSSALQLRPAVSSVPEPGQIALIVVVVLMAGLGILFARLW